MYAILFIHFIHDTLIHYTATHAQPLSAAEFIQMPLNCPYITKPMLVVCPCIQNNRMAKCPFSATVSFLEYDLYTGKMSGIRDADHSQ